MSSATGSGVSHVSGPEKNKKKDYYEDIMENYKDIEEYYSSIININAGEK
ncbi:hypothetical protein [Lachnospira pectinoschiza]|nr:hypothetical protein [Lachnospira pectinoschiza]